MNTNLQSPQSIDELPEAAREIVNCATVSAREVKGAVKDAAADATDAAKDAYQALSAKAGEGVGHSKEYAQHAVDASKDAAKDMYQSAALKAEDTLATSKEYVRQNPLLVVVGAIAFGAAIGCMLMMARRQPTFRERYVDEPLDSARDAILAALAPVAQRLHVGYDSARDGAGKALERVHRFNSGRAADTLSEQIGRVGSNLKFW